MFHLLEVGKLIYFLTPLSYLLAMVMCKHYCVYWYHHASQKTIISVHQSAERSNVVNVILEKAIDSKSKNPKLLHGDIYNLLIMR